MGLVQFLTQSLQYYTLWAMLRTEHSAGRPANVPAIATNIYTSQDKRENVDVHRITRVDSAFIDPVDLYSQVA